MDLSQYEFRQNNRNIDNNNVDKNVARYFQKLDRK